MENQKPIRQAQGKKVEIYSTNTCQYCVLAKRYFDSKGIEYTNYNVGEDQAKAVEMMRRSGEQGVPMIFIDGVLVRGFNRPQIDALLGLDDSRQAA